MKHCRPALELEGEQIFIIECSILGKGFEISFSDDSEKVFVIDVPIFYLIIEGYDQKSMPYYNTMSMDNYSSSNATKQ